MKLLIFFILLLFSVEAVSHDRIQDEERMVWTEDMKTNDKGEAISVIRRGIYTPAFAQGVFTRRCELDDQGTVTVYDDESLYDAQGEQLTQELMGHETHETTTGDVLSICRGEREADRAGAVSVSETKDYNDQGEIILFSISTVHKQKIYDEQGRFVSLHTSKRSSVRCDKAKDKGVQVSYSITIYPLPPDKEGWSYPGYNIGNMEYYADEDDMVSVCKNFKFPPVPDIR